MRRPRNFQTDRCYHLVNRMGHCAFYMDEYEPWHEVTPPLPLHQWGQTLWHSPKSVKRVYQEVHKHTHSRNVLLPVDVVVDRVNKLLKGWGAFYSVGYPSRVFRKVNHYVLKRMARFLNRKSQRYYRLKFADTYYGEMTHYGLYRLAWGDVRRTRN